MYSNSAFFDKHEEVRAEREHLRITREEYAAKLSQGRAAAKAASLENARRRKSQQNRQKQKEEEEERRRKEILAHRKAANQHHVRNFRRRTESDSSGGFGGTVTKPPRPLQGQRGSGTELRSTVRRVPDTGANHHYSSSQLNKPQQGAAQWPFAVRSVPDAVKLELNHQVGNQSHHPQQTPEPTDIEKALEDIGAVRNHRELLMTNSGVLSAVSPPPVPGNPAIEEAARLQPASAQRAVPVQNDGEDPVSEDSVSDNGGGDSKAATANRNLRYVVDDSPMESGSEVEGETLTQTPSQLQLSPLKNPNTTHLFEQPATISLEKSESARKMLRLSQRPSSATAWEADNIRPDSISPPPDLNEVFSDSLEMLNVTDDSDSDQRATISGNSHKTTAENGPRRATPYPRGEQRVRHDSNIDVCGDSDLSETNDNSGRQIQQQKVNMVYHTGVAHSSSDGGFLQVTPPGASPTRRGRSASLSSLTAVPKNSHDPVPRGIIKKTRQAGVPLNIAAVGGMEQQLTRMARTQSEDNLAKRRITFLDHEVILNHGKRHDPPPVHLLGPDSRSQTPRKNPPAFHPRYSVGAPLDRLLKSRPPAQRQRQQQQQQTGESVKRPPRAAPPALRQPVQAVGSPQLSQRGKGSQSESTVPVGDADSSKDALWHQVRRCLSTTRHDSIDGLHSAHPPPTQLAAAQPVVAVVAAVPNAATTLPPRPLPAHVHLRKSAAAAVEPKPAATSDIRHGVIGQSTFYHTLGGTEESGGDRFVYAQSRSSGVRGNEPAQALTRAKQATSVPRKALAATSGASYSRMLEHYRETKASGEVVSPYQTSTSSGQRLNSFKQPPASSSSSLASNAGGSAGGGSERRNRSTLPTNPALERQEMEIMKSLQHIDKLLHDRKKARSSSHSDLKQRDPLPAQEQVTKSHSEARLHGRRKATPPTHTAHSQHSTSAGPEAVRWATAKDRPALTKDHYKSRASSNAAANPRQVQRGSSFNF